MTELEQLPPENECLAGFIAAWEEHVAPPRSHSAYQPTDEGEDGRLAVQGARTAGFDRLLFRIHSGPHLSWAGRC